MAGAKGRVKCKDCQDGTKDGYRKGSEGRGGKEANGSMEGSGKVWGWMRREGV